MEVRISLFAAFRNQLSRRVFIGPVLGIFGIQVSSVGMIIHIVTWVVSLFSVYRKCSVLKDMIELFF